MITTFTDPLDISKIEYFHRFSLDPDYSFEGHVHESIEMNVVLKGAMEITCGGSVLKAREGDLILIKPGIFHKNHSLSSNVSDMISAHFFTNDIKFPVMYHRCALDNENLYVLELLLEEIQKECRTDEWCVTGTMTAMAKKLLEIFLIRALRSGNKPLYSSDNDSLVYHKAVNFMMRNIDKNLSVREIAFEVNSCETILKRAFSKYAGKGVISYFSSLKADRAKAMLEEGKSCHEVSEILGYSSQAYFSRCFKKMIGVLPSEVHGKKTE